VTDCETIDSGNTPTNTLNFTYTLTKPTDQVVGNGKIKIMLKFSSNSDGRSIKTEDVFSTSWSEDETYSETIEVDLSSSDIQENGSSIYLEYESFSGVEYPSCEYPLIKFPPPSFTLSPQELSLDCGDTTPRTFSITASNIPAGSQVTYTWFYNGWSLINYDSNSRFLRPTSGINLPSDINVLPLIDGVLQPDLISRINRAAYNPSYSIFGSATLCRSSNYSINNLGSGETITGWNISNSSIASITTNGNQVTLIANGSGTVTLTATIQNSCGQTADITRNVFVGFPAADGNTEIWAGTPGVNPVSTFPGATYKFEVEDVPGANSYTWVLPSGFSVLNGGSTTTTSTSIFVTTSSTSGTYTMNCRANNPCGLSWTDNLTITNGSIGGGGGGNNCPPGFSPPCAIIGPHPLSVSPNPASNFIEIGSRYESGKNEKASGFSAEDYSYKLYDFNGKLIQKVSFVNSTRVDVSKLNKGRYILITKTGDQDKTHHIIVE
jgi:hypothetical protein